MAFLSGLGSFEFIYFRIYLLKNIVLINILVGGEGIGPSTSVLSGQRSTTELAAHQNIYRDILLLNYAFSILQGKRFKKCALKI